MKVLGLLLSVLLVACGDFRQENLTNGPTSFSTTTNKTESLISSPESINTGTFSIEKMLANQTALVIAPKVAALRTASQELLSEVDKLCALTESSAAQSFRNSSRLIAQDKWRQVMALFHQLEMMQLGLLKEKSSDIYSWPQFNSCRLALEIGFRVPRQAERYQHNASANLSGLAAIEFLLFAEKEQHGCDERNATRLSQWFDTSELEQNKNRCQVLLPATQKTHELIAQVARQWSKYGDNFPETLLSSDVLQQIGALSDHMQITLDQVTKDIRLARPLGIKGCNNSAKCEDAVEHPYSDFGLEAIKNNIIGFKQLYLGTTFNSIDGMGYDDFLNAEELSTVDNKMKAGITLIERSIESVELGFRASLTDKTTSCELLEHPLCRVHTEIDTFDDLLKIDFLNALSQLSIPKIPQGDGD
jgi:hypothetical protein